MTKELSIRELGPQELYIASELTARGMRDNPLDIAAFGADPNGRAMNANEKTTKASKVPSRCGSNGKKIDGKTSTDAIP